MALETGKVQGDILAQSRITGTVNRGDSETLQARNDNQRPQQLAKKLPSLSGAEPLSKSQGKQLNLYIVMPRKAPAAGVDAHPFWVAASPAQSCLPAGSSCTWGCLGLNYFTEIPSSAITILSYPNGSCPFLLLLSQQVTSDHLNRPDKPSEGTENRRRPREPPVPFTPTTQAL